MCIMCCRKNQEAEISLFLKPNSIYRDRKLEVIKCIICGALIAELKQFNIQKQEYEIIRPKSKKTSKFLLKLQRDNKELKMPTIPTGTKSNAAWAYGVNKERKNGRLFQYRKDFNGTSKLVKIIDKGVNKQNGNISS